MMSKITAVLGPTNTGKTHFALERMLGYRTGMIGLPLRLLAREVYDRVVAQKGERLVALITGEEKIRPRDARYFVCTVEAMPPDQPVECLVVDEIQLASHPERGHVFTDRLLHARGLSETMFLGAETMKSLIEALVPGVDIITRPRLSQLSYAGYKKPARLPPRSAIVTFSASDVYRIAEFMRQHRGGTAVVLGALSPRTRNAQVDLFERGEVDYLVATDAIGMGLNLDIAHVALARDFKFDGRNGRRLMPEEVAQIAGRAGRHMRDGTFGTTFELKAFAPELVEAIEEHRFDPVAKLLWRNVDLNFANPQALLASLERRPDRRCFVQMQDADDHLALKALTRRLELEKRDVGRDRTRLLWEICQIPDFRKIMSDDHIRLLGEIFGHLGQRRGRLPADWVNGEIRRLDDTRGTIEMLTASLAAIRTWTYVTAKTGWVELGDELHGQARDTENRISDALHERLSERFVDRRSATFARAAGTGADLLAGVRPDGEVLVEGHKVGDLKGFRFVIDETVGGIDRDLVLKTAYKALAQEMRGRIASFERERGEAFALGLEGTIAWQGEAIARLASSSKRLDPDIAVLKSDLIDPPQEALIATRLKAWLHTELRRRLQTLFGLLKAQDTAVDPELRGIAFRMIEGSGILPRDDWELTRGQENFLRSRGVTLGARYFYMKGLLKPEIVGFLALLWNVQHGRKLPVPKPNKVSLAVGEGDRAFYEAIGYPVLGGRAVRIDRLDELCADLAAGRELPMKTLTQRLTCTPKEAKAVIEALGKPAAKPTPDHAFRHSPFAELRDAVRD
jgi:ATP-dependent RNA helicase SUPV3L1/SUV3